MPLFRVPAATQGSGPEAISVVEANCTPAGRQVGSRLAEEFGAIAVGVIGGAAGESGQFETPEGGPTSAGGNVVGVGVGIGSGVMWVGCGVGIGSGVAGCCGGASG